MRIDGVSRFLSLVFWGGALVGSFAISSSVWAKEPGRQFLEALRKRGYGEVAVDYLEVLKARDQVPDELVDKFDYEMSLSLRAAARQALGRRQQDALLARSEEYLKKYAEAHPEAAAETSAVGDPAFENAVTNLHKALAMKDPKARAAALVEVRKALEEVAKKNSEAAARWANVVKQLQAKIDQMPGAAAGKKAPRRTPTKEEAKLLKDFTDAQSAWLDARYKLACIDFHISETMVEPAEKKDREALIAKASRSFNALYQENNEQPDPLVPLLTHIWQGRCEFELGHYEDALEIFDEALAYAPDDGKSDDPSLDPLLAEANYYNLMTVLRAKGVGEFGRAATLWLETNKRWNKYNGYQGVVLELCKAQLELAQKAPSAKQKEMIVDAVNRLKDNGKIPSTYQSEINLLLRDSRKAGTKGGDPTTVEEALALAEDAEAGADWPAAISAWTQVRDLASKSKSAAATDAKKRAAEGLPLAQYRVAYQKFTANHAPQEAHAKLSESFAEFSQIASDNASSRAAPVAASYAVRAAFMLYVDAKKRGDAAAVDEAFKRLNAAVEFTQSHWPDRAEADEVRIILGQASLVRSAPADAIKAFNSVNPKSDFYPRAMFLAGQTHAQLYVAEKQKPEDQRNQKLMADELAQAEVSLTKCVESNQALDDSAEKGSLDANFTKQKIEGVVRLAEILLEANKAGAAAKLLDPQLEAIKATKPESLDSVLLRAFQAGAKANMAAGQPARAGAVALTLASLGPDDEAVNGLLSNLTRLLLEDFKKAETGLNEAKQDSDPLVERKAQLRFNAAKELLSQLMEQLAKRKNFRLDHKLHVAVASAQVGRADIASQLYSAVLQAADADPEFAKKNEAQLMKVRADVIGLRLQKGDYSGAKEAIDKLLAERPTAVPLLMERGRIMQSWAERDPSKWEEAIAVWSDVRVKLGSQKQKTRDYYEAVYNAAYCLSAVGEKNKEKAKQALQLLNTIYTLEPKLKTMPDLAAKYKLLIDKLSPNEAKS